MGQGAAVTSLTLTPQSAVLVNNDPENLSHLTSGERTAIAAMQEEIHQLHRELFKDRGSGHNGHHAGGWPSFSNGAADGDNMSQGFELFQNKHFNKLRLRFVNLNAKEIRAQLRRIWHEQLTPDERHQFQLIARQQIE